MTKSAWLKQVATLLNDRDVASAAVPAGKWTARNIETERGDEPLDAFETNQTPREYADYLELEYQTFGPQGE